MSHTRREFLDRLALGAVGAAALASLPLPAAAAGPAPETKWDLSWGQRVTGKHRAVFDVTSIDGGRGVWRASGWGLHYQQVLGTAPRDLSTVVVLRHEAIPLAMSDAFWQRYGIGKERGATHPLTGAPTDRNPALISDLDAPYDALALDKLIARGGVVLACGLAFDDPVATIKGKDGVSEEAARERAIGMLVPGVILQPSGIFAAVRAQEAGCHYVHAS